MERVKFDKFKEDFFKLMKKYEDKDLFFGVLVGHLNRENGLVKFSSAGNKMCAKIIENGIVHSGGELHGQEE